jgi:hypothetical protein
MEKIIREQRRSGLSYEAELELLAEVYRLALESYQERKKKAKKAKAPYGRKTKDDE